MPHKSIAVLLTRPRAASEGLAEALSQMGYQTVIEPLLTIAPTDAPAAAMNDITASIITSANALEAAEPARAKLAFLFALPCFCVGSETTAKARVAGFRDVRNAEGDGSALAALILQSGIKGPFLHIAGRDIDRAMQDAMREAGLEVRHWAVYAATPTTTLSADLVMKLRKKQLKAVLLFSARSADTLKMLIARYALEACCKDLIAIGISKAVTDMLEPLPWRRLERAAQPNEKAVIERLCELLPIS